MGDYEWYVACNVPATYVSSFGKGASLTIRLPFVSDEEIPVKVARPGNRDRNGQMAVIFRCENMSKELSSLRMEDVQHPAGQAHRPARSQGSHCDQRSL